MNHAQRPQRPSTKLMTKLVFALVLISLSSCGVKVDVNIGRAKIKTILSGVATPFVGLISAKNQSSLLIQSANATACADPVFAKIFLIEADGSINDNDPLMTQQLGPDARFSFNIQDLGKKDLNTKVQFIIKAEGCNGDVYKRPVTNLDDKQDIDAKTTLVTEVVNASALVPTLLNETSRTDIEKLISTISGSSVASAMDSLQNDSGPASKFIEIFGISPDVILSAKPEVNIAAVKNNLRELTPFAFRANSFHIDPSYSFVYSWKLDGVVKAATQEWNYTPSANESGTHQIDVYVGKNNGSGSIDLTKPYYVKTFSVKVDNNIAPVAPAITLNAANPTPVNLNSVQVDIATGAGLANCSTFSKIAITDSLTIPGSGQFTINCTMAGTQTQTVSFSTGDGTKNLYAWAIDTEGSISPPKNLNFILDTVPPVLSLTFAPTLLRGGTTQAVTLSAVDSGTGVNHLDLYYSATGAAPFTLLSNLSANATSYSWSIPTSNTTNSRLQLIATDFTGASTTVYSSSFNIDSLAPTAPAFSRTSSATSNSTTVALSTTCIADYNKVIYSESNSSPALSDSNWENCAATKNFTVSSTNGTKTIYAYSRDAAGNISTSANVTMTLDTTPPADPVINLVSNAISSSTGVAFTATDCLDRPYLFVSESIIAPAVNDVGWQACSTTASAITHILTGPAVQGTHNLYIFAKDSVGNISLPAMKSMIYDTTTPTVLLNNTIASLYKGGDVVALDFSASDANGLSNFKLEYAANGSTYSLVTNLASTATTYNWTIPADNSVNAKIRLVATDNSTTANVTTVVSSAFTIDSIAPTAPGLTRTSALNSSSATVTLTVGSCTDTASILISESATKPLVGDAGWLACSTAASNYTKTVSTQGAHTFYAWAKDTAGNIAATASTASMVFDNINPSIVSGPVVASAVSGGKSYNITWNSTDANTLSIKLELFNGTSWSDIATALTNTGTYTWSVPSLDISTAVVKMTVVDLAGNSSTNSTSAFIIDSHPPIVDSLAINSGATNTSNNNVQIALSAHDTLSKVKYFCLQFDDTTKPSVTSACWNDVTAPIPGIASATAITFSNFFFQVGFTKGSKTVYAWVKDESGQISNNAAAVADSASIYFDPGTPPKITAIQVTNSDTPNSPTTSADTTVTTSGYMYIKWNASDDEGLATNPITINYTSNDTVFNALTGGTNIANASNGNCTVDAGFTGCVRLTPPLNTYFKIRVIAKDTLDTTTFLNSSPLNDSKVKILAGNTDDGLNGSAISAMFFTNGASKDVSTTWKNRLAISEDGKIFYVDKIRGLLWINPTNGVLKKFINATGTVSGDGGNVSAATLKGATAIAMDFQNNLLIWDTDRIRKVNLSTMVITTIVGGGAATDPSTTVASNTMLLGAFSGISSTFIPLPNGDILFTAPTGSMHDRRFRASDNKVELIDLQGQGFRSFPTDAWSATARMGLAVDFNPITSAVNTMLKGFNKIVPGDSYYIYSRVDHNTGNETTPYPELLPHDVNMDKAVTHSGLDGKIYFIDRFRWSVYKYNATTNTSALILGTGVAGTTPCAENTLATACKVDIDSIFITKTGRVYFIDNGVLRTINDSSRVITLFGQYPSYGNGGLATVSRFGLIQDIKMGKATPVNNKIIIQDSYANEFREFTLDGNISKIADAETTWHGPFSFVSDSATGDLIFPRGGNLQKFTRSTSLWSTIVGGGSTTYYDATADGKTGNNINLVSTYNNSVSSSGGGKLFFSKYVYESGSNVRCMTKMYDIADSYRQTHFLGGDTCASTNGNGVLLKDVKSIPNGIGNIESFEDPTDSITKYYYSPLASNIIYSGIIGGNSNVFATLAHPTHGFTHNYNVDGLNIYYCSTSGYLFKYLFSTNQTVPLTWQSPTLRCKPDGRTLIYNSDKNSLIFIFQQSGMYGVAEYNLN